MTRYTESDHYDVQFTGPQLATVCGLLVILVGGVFVGGILIGRGMSPEAADAIRARAGAAANPAGTAPETVADGGTDQLRLPLAEPSSPGNAGGATGADREVDEEGGVRSFSPEQLAARASAPATTTTPPTTTTTTTTTNNNNAGNSRPSATPAPERRGNGPGSARSEPPRQVRDSGSGARSGSPAATTVPTSASSASSGSGNFTIQVAALRNRGAAEALSQQLVERGLAAYIEGAPNGLFRVRVGRFESRDAARETVARLQRDDFQALITTR